MLGCSFYVVIWPVLTFSSGWRRRRQGPRSGSRTPISLSLWTRTPPRFCRRGTKWVLSLSSRTGWHSTRTVVVSCHLTFKMVHRSVFIPVTIVWMIPSDLWCFLLPGNILVCFVLLQIREQNRFDVMTSGPRSQHLAGIPVDAPRQVRRSFVMLRV